MSRPPAHRDVAPLAAHDPLPRQVAQVADDAAVMRVGRVVRYSSASITVAVNGSDVLVQAPYLPSYVPVLGDNVIIVRTGATWVVLGTLSGNPADNQVFNYSFELDNPGTSPATGWDTYQQLGAASLDVATISNGLEIDGQQAYRVHATALATSITYISSRPIAVVPGQVWAGAAFASVISLSGVLSSLNGALTFYANINDTYPTTSAPSAQFGSLTLKGASPTWYPLRTGGSTGGIVIPDAAAYMRVTLLTQCQPDAAGDVTVYWDRVIARRIS